jgi:hypothetical protein
MNNYALACIICLVGVFATPNKNYQAVLIGIQLACVIMYFIDKKKGLI